MSKNKKGAQSNLIEDDLQTLNYTNGNRYFGVVKDEKPHGHGTLFRYANGEERFEGEFVMGVPQGYGTTTYSEKEFHEGYYKNGKYEGFGTYEFESGAKYEGKYRNGVQEGDGTYHYENGDVVKGTYVNGILDGPAVYKYESGEVF